MTDYTWLICQGKHDWEHMVIMNGACGSYYYTLPGLPTLPTTVHRGYKDIHCTRCGLVAANVGQDLLASEPEP